jgi:hypothetical protein
MISKVMTTTDRQVHLQELPQLCDHSEDDDEYRTDGDDRGGGRSGGDATTFATVAQLHDAGRASFRQY